MGNQQEAMGEQFKDGVANFFKWLELFMKTHAQQKEASKQYAFASAIDKHLQGKDNTVIGYSVSDNEIRDKLKAELKHDNIPFIEMKMGRETVIVIRDIDEQNFELAKNGVQTIVGNYYQEMDKLEMANIFEKYSPFDKHPAEKQFLEFSELDPTFAHILRNKCNDLARGFMVGTEIEDGKAELIVQGKKVINLENSGHGDLYSRDVCRAFLAATLAYGGPNREKNIKQIEADDKTELEILEYKGSEPKYIVSQNNPSVCLAITNEGYQIGRLNQDTKEYEFGEINSSRNLNYKKELAMQLSGIFDIVIEDDFEKIAKHAKGEIELESVRPQKTFKENMISRAESIATDKIDAVIKKQLAKDDSIKHLPSDKILKKYQEMMKEVFVGLETGVAPKWMEKEEFKQLVNDLNTIDFNYTNYKENINQLINGTKLKEKSARQIITEERDKTRNKTKNKEKNRDEREL